MYTPHQVKTSKTSSLLPSALLTSAILPSVILPSVLLMGLISFSPASAQLEDTGPIAEFATLSISSPYIETIEIVEANMKDPIPCVPCDGDNLNTLSLHVDVSDLVPFMDAWRLQGIFLTIEKTAYWLDRSGDASILSKYSNGDYEGLIIEDFYGLIPENGGDLGLLFKFLHQGEIKWIKSAIKF